MPARHLPEDLLTSVRRQFTFEAAHQLTWHPGKCRNLHGHSYVLDVEVTCPLNDHGIVIDFSTLKDTVNEHVLADYDHAYLNDLLTNPTAELIAVDIAHRLRDAGLHVTEVTVHETATCSATVRLATH